MKRKQERWREASKDRAARLFHYLRNNALETNRNGAVFITDHGYQACSDWLAAENRRGYNRGRDAARKENG